MATVADRTIQPEGENGYDFGQFWRGSIEIPFSCAQFRCDLTFCGLPLTMHSLCNQRPTKDVVTIAISFAIWNAHNAEGTRSNAQIPLC